MTFRFLHLADLHLDSAYGGRPATRSALRAETIEAFERAVRYVQGEGLDALVIAGDAFDDGSLGREQRARFRSTVQGLVRGGVHVVYATGNHDPGGPGFQARTLGLTDLGRSARGHLHLALDGTPRHFVLERDGAPVCEVAAAGHVGPRVTDDLAATLGAWGTDDLPRLAVLHTQVGGAGGAGDHAPYAPCTVETLARSGAHYWALGHVHVRGRVAPDVEAWYPGNLVGRNARESGPKGGLVVTLDAEGVRRAPQFLRLADIEHRTVRAHCAGSPAARKPEDVAHSLQGPLGELATAGTAPRLVLRAELTGHLDDALRRELADPEARRALEDAVLVELRSLGLDVELLELELQDRTAGGELSDDALLDELLRSPSAARAALELARALDLGPEAADALDVDWSLPRAATTDERRRRVREIGGDLQAEVLRRLAQGRND